MEKLLSSLSAGKRQINQALASDLASFSLEKVIAFFYKEAKHLPKEEALVMVKNIRISNNICHIVYLI